MAPGFHRGVADPSAVDPAEIRDRLSGEGMLGRAQTQGMRHLQAAGIGLTLAVIAVIAGRISQDGQKVGCAENLRAIGQALKPGGTGKALLRELNLEPKILSCPISAKVLGSVSYRGPKRPLESYGPDEPIVCDEHDNHPGGWLHVLTRGGKVIEARPGDPLYGKALENTSD